MAPNRSQAPAVSEALTNMTLKERVAAAGVTPGFSARINDAEFQQATKKGNRTFLIILIIVALALAPLVTFIAWLINPQDVSLMIGAYFVVELIVIIIVIVQLIKRFRGKCWDGEVVGKYVGKERSGNSGIRTAVYVTQFVTDQGKKKRHKEKGRSVFYDYLQVGDRVRYHPQLSFPFEKYDKTTSARLVCPFCGIVQDIESDYCGGCGKPLLK